MHADQDAYVLWNYRLEDQFLLADSYDGAVQLAITPHTLARAITATDGGEWSPEKAEEHFTEAVAAVYASSVLRNPAKLRALTSADAEEVPFATGFLALSVLAAFHMHTDDEHSALAFYPRLATMLGCAPTEGAPEGFDGEAFLELWAELDWWLATRHGRRLAQAPGYVKAYLEAAAQTHGLSPEDLEKKVEQILGGCLKQWLVDPDELTVVSPCPDTSGNINAYRCSRCECSHLHPSGGFCTTCRAPLVSAPAAHSVTSHPVDYYELDARTSSIHATLRSSSSRPGQHLMERRPPRAKCGN